MVNATPTGSETIQSSKDGRMFTESEILLSSSISLALQSVLVVVSCVTYLKARSACLQREGGELRVVKRGHLVSLAALTVMLTLAFASLLMSALDIRAVGGYAGKLHVAYKTFDDEYFLFMSVRGVQFYLYMAQTMVANVLMIRTLFAKQGGYPKAGAYAIVFFFFAAVFGCSAFANPSWAFQFLAFTTAINLVTLIPSLRDSRDIGWTPRALAKFVFSRAFCDAIVRSAALYRGASFSLFVTFYLDPNLLFYPNISVLSPLMGIAFSLACASANRDDPSDGAIRLPQDEPEVAEV